MFRIYFELDVRLQGGFFTLNVIQIYSSDALYKLSLAPVRHACSTREGDVIHFSFK